MVIAGFVIPSPGISIPSQKARESDYHALGRPTDPEMLIVPVIKLRAPIVPIVSTPDNVLHPPADTHEVGWWRYSAKPGATDGQTVLTGHTVHTGGGVMNRLGELKPGALVQIKTKRGTLDYWTTKVFVYTREQLAKHANELFSQEREHNRLVLVTCTGWTGSEYTSNIIVFATPLGVRNKKAGPTPSPTPTKKAPTKAPTNKAPGQKTEKAS
jgi:LPXTG-site transpeptidase (sortase) family protein